MHPSFMKGCKAPVAACFKIGARCCQRCDAPCAVAARCHVQRGVAAYTLAVRPESQQSGGHGGQPVAAADVASCSWRPRSSAYPCPLSHRLPARRVLPRARGLLWGELACG